MRRVVRLRVPVLRLAAGLRDELPLAPELVFAAPVDRDEVERFAVERLAAGLRAVDARLLAAPAVFARDDVARVAVERFAAGLRRALALRAVPREDPPDEVEPSLADHLPDITRFAASATASAINEPNFVALAIMLVAACDAVSAASSPASRIARRALGLALIAAAAAARPAASISLLIAAFASLSTVSDELDEEREEVFLADFAMLLFSCVAEESSLTP